jgi:hypothetical protein
MKIRLRCPNCRASFEVAGDPVPETAVCPECDTIQRTPIHGGASEVREAAPAEGVSVFVPSGRSAVEPRKPWRRRLYIGVGLCLLLIAGGLASWPWLEQRLWQSEPKDPVERVARSYLEALIGDDIEQAQRLGTVEEPPAIRSFGDVARVKEHDQSLRGKFGPIARLNKQIDEKFSFDPQINRFTPKNPLGPAAVVLDTLHEAKEQQDKSGITDRLVGGSEHENLDAAVEFGESQLKMIGKLAEGVLAPKRLIPTYSMLVNDAKPPLPETEKELALDFGENHETWGALLKRPFLTLKADGPYILDRAEVVATVHDKLSSLGDPPSTLRLKLVRFRLEGIDTGWKVISARRVTDEPQEESAVPSEAEPSSGLGDSLGDVEPKDP